MKIVSIIFTIVVVLIGVSFAVLNKETVPINFFNLYQFEHVVISLALIIAFAAGALAGLLASLAIILRLKRSKNRLEKELKKSDQSRSLMQSGIHEREPG